MKLIKCLALILALLPALNGPARMDTGRRSESKKGMDDMFTMAEIIDMLKNDTPNDGMGLVWDGEQLTVVDDPLDREGIMDGRGGPYAYNRRKAAITTVYSVDSTGLLTDEKVVADDENGFLAASDTRMIRIARSDEPFETVVEQHNARVAEGTALEYTMRCQKETVCESALLEAPDGIMMIGVRIFAAAEDGGSMVYEYGGIGNFSTIMVEARMMAMKTIW